MQATLHNAAIVVFVKHFWLLLPTKAGLISVIKGLQVPLTHRTLGFLPVSDPPPPGTGTSFSQVNIQATEHLWNPHISNIPHSHTGGRSICSVQENIASLLLMCIIMFSFDVLADN